MTDDDCLRAKRLVRTIDRLGLRSAATERLTKDLDKTNSDLVRLTKDLVRLTNVLVGLAERLRHRAKRHRKLDKVSVTQSKVQRLLTKVLAED